MYLDTSLQWENRRTECLAEQCIWLNGVVYSNTTSRASSHFHFSDYSSRSTYHSRRVPHPFLHTEHPFVFSVDVMKRVLSLGRDCGRLGVYVYVGIRVGYPCVCICFSSIYRYTIHYDTTLDTCALDRIQTTAQGGSGKVLILRCWRCRHENIQARRAFHRRLAHDRSRLCRDARAAPVDVPDRLPRSVLGLVYVGW